MRLSDDRACALAMYETARVCKPVKCAKFSPVHGNGMTTGTSRGQGGDDEHTAQINHNVLLSLYRESIATKMHKKTLLKTVKNNKK
jgi:hypothetical protein